MLRATQPCFERRYKRIPAHLNQTGCPVALLVDDVRSTGDQRLLRYAKKIARSALNVSTSLVEVVPGNFGKGKSLLRFDEFCFYLFHCIASC